MKLLINSLAPEFSLKDKDGKSYTLKDIKSDYIVLYFYPKDNTPGCTLEANDFTKLKSDFKKIKTEIIGISGGNEMTKQKFCEKNELTILLLSDTDFKVSEKYSVYSEKNFMGKKFKGISRTTFILDKKKNIIKVYDKVNPLGHAKNVLEFIKGLK